MIGRRWRADEFCVDASLLAPRLLGQYVIHETPQGICSGRIVETEAYGGSYDGFPDDGAHSFRGLTKRTAPMFHAGGISYVYLIYGMYCCFNVVAGPEGEGQAVLIRAIEPICGTDLMAARRKARKAGRNLTNGPALSGHGHYARGKRFRFDVFLPVYCPSRRRGPVYSGRFAAYPY